jgi:hypothetical protein
MKKKFKKVDLTDISRGKHKNAFSKSFNKSLMLKKKKALFRFASTISIRKI